MWGWALYWLGGIFTAAVGDGLLCINPMQANASERSVG